MRAIALLSAICGSAVAMPAALDDQQQQYQQQHHSPLEARDGAVAEPTSPWVTVDDEGRPATTFTPSMTTISGTPTAVNGAPHDLTASVYTWTSWGLVSTSTGEPPNPTATSKSNQGTFSRCYNKDGDFAPFCRPSHNSTLLTGSTYYVTWDPDYYNKTASTFNTTYDITVRLDFWNASSNAWDKLITFDDNRVPASWGFFPLSIDSKYTMGEKLNNLTITLLSGPHGSQDKKNSISLPVAVATPALPQNHPTPVPHGKTLYIALPVCLGAFILFVIGGCIWNKKTRRIELGSIMGHRSRHGYSGRKTRRRMFRAKDHHGGGGGIQLDSPIAASAGGAAASAAAAATTYHPHATEYEYHDTPDQGRRDSDVLGSLAESPVRESFEHQDTLGGGHTNAFRDEIHRQDDERRHY